MTQGARGKGAWPDGGIPLMDGLGAVKRNVVEFTRDQYSVVLAGEKLYKQTPYPDSSAHKRLFDIGYPIAAIWKTIWKMASIGGRR
jgi:hypothetical protein